jgi:lipopolysaccharide export system protein LptA
MKSALLVFSLFVAVFSLRLAMGADTATAATPASAVATAVSSPASIAAPATPVPAATSLPKEALKPIDIDADVFEVNGKEKKGVFRGNVVARQGDVTVRATRVEAIYSKEAKGITRAVAEGGVTVTSGTKVGKSDRAEFNNDQHTIVLTGEPRLWEEGSILEGKQIVFHVTDGRVECFECSIDVDPTKVQEITNDAKKPQ